MELKIVVRHFRVTKLVVVYFHGTKISSKTFPWNSKFVVRCFHGTKIVQSDECLMTIM